ncbi:MAG: GNAT superfamily N-acetyltransferase [Bacteroidia bacterium]|jgi:GNAT superfamily N-acetyltransferase
MNNIQIIALLPEKKGDVRRFLQMADIIYKNDEHFIPHIHQDLSKIFTRHLSQPNKGELMLWLAKMNGKWVGRIAAFNERDKAHLGIGFFESINNRDVSNALFDQALSWLKQLETGKHRVEGPINFGERDKFWGLMVGGFKNPGYQENYNPPYYQHLFEHYGFEPGLRQTTQELALKDFDAITFGRIANRAIEQGGFTFKHLKTNDLHRYADDFTHIYNLAWQQHAHFLPLKSSDVLLEMEMMKPIVQEDLIWFAYYNDKPVAFYASLPDVNQIFKKVGPNLNALGKMKFLWHRAFTKITRVRGIVFGVVPQCWGKGLESALIMKVYEVLKNHPHITATELSWIGDFNPKMLRLLARLGAKESKVHITYNKFI